MEYIYCFIYSVIVAICTYIIYYILVLKKSGKKLNGKEIIFLGITFIIVFTVINCFFIKS